MMYFGEIILSQLATTTNVRLSLKQIGKIQGSFGLV